MEMKEIKQNTKKLEINVRHNIAATHTHKVQPLHTAVAAHEICNSACAVSADIIGSLSNNANERWR